MKKYLYAVCLLIFFTITSQQVLAENAVFDSSSNTLTIPNVEFENDTSLYNIKLQLQQDGSLSLLNIDPKPTKNNEKNDDIEFLYHKNPFLITYQIYSSLQGEHVTELEGVENISEGKKWNQEYVIGTYTNSFLQKFEFYEDGTGILTCRDEEVGPTTICQEVSSFDWTIDSYGNLIFGIFKHYSSLDIYYRFIWALVDFNDNNSMVTVYERTLQITGNSSLILSEGIANFTKE